MGWRSLCFALITFQTERRYIQLVLWLRDLTLVGVYGHSTGGGATIQFCGVDARCSAGLTQDPFMTPVSQEVLEDSGETTIPLRLQSIMGRS